MNLGVHMKKLICFILSLTAINAFSMGKTRDLPKLETVSHVDLNRYLGKWYEVARFTLSFEKNCVGATANYSLREDGSINVINTCFKGTLAGKLKTAHGHAKVVDKETGSKLKVSFFGPFYAPYWIIDLGENYEYAVVGSPNRDTLWILSRTPALDPAVLKSILERAELKGFDTAKLEYPAQVSQ